MRQQLSKTVHHFTRSRVDCGRMDGGQRPHQPILKSLYRILRGLQFIPFSLLLLFAGLRVVRTIHTHVCVFDIKG